MCFKNEQFTSCHKKGADYYLSCIYPIFICTSHGKGLSMGKPLRLNLRPLMFGLGVKEMIIIKLRV